MDERRESSLIRRLMWWRDCDRFLVCEDRSDLGFVANALFSCSSRARSRAVDLFCQYGFLELNTVDR